MAHQHSCYNCIYHLTYPNEYETRCSKTNKIIDDGFGEGDCIPCEKFSPFKNTFAFSNDLASDILPF